mmetsp:Transcript_18025/g.50071  ORF Transcript_18025/g.50071 Transcript_18025/m.50071 type:complete len:600 (-) Transcript_18025:330-2129(-)
MGDLDADAPALLEWLNSLEVVTRRYDRLSELADGEALLRVMHDLSPDGFPSPSMIGNSEVLVRLLEGLEQHLRDRGGAGSQDETCLQCLEQAKAGFVQPVHLAKLALVATVQNDLPKRRDYVEAIMSLSVEAQQAAQAIIERFMSGSGLDSPSGRYPTADRPRHNSFSPTFSPPPRAASVRDMTRERLDFTEVGLDVEERFRRLKDEYIAVMEEQERRQEERAALRKDLEAERKRRREAEEAEREAKAERKLAEEARERVREETRVLYEGRMLQEAARAAERLRHLDLELEGLREELGLARVQAANAEKLSNQLELCKQKIEEGHTLRRENKELRVQVDDLLAKPSGGGGGAEHMQRSLARAREDAAAAAREREEAQRQLVLLKEELASGQQLQRGLAEEVRTLRSGGSGGSAAAAPGAGRGGDGHGRALALEAGSALLAAATAEASVGDVVPPDRRQDDMLERLLVEKERATRAETTLQVKSAELTTLQDQKVKDAVKLATLEAKLDALKSQGTASSTTKAVSQEAEAKIKELEGQLAVSDRELQVLRLREGAEKESLHAQETLMASCFHELGLRYQKLRLQDQLAQMQASERGPSGS